MLYQISHRLFKGVHSLNIVLLIEVLLNYKFNSGNAHRSLKLFE